jgi:hypothetical protein
MAMDASTERFWRTASARISLPLVAEVASINISFNMSDYNHFLGGVDRHDATLAHWQELHAEDVLR